MLGNCEKHFEAVKDMQFPKDIKDCADKSDDKSDPFKFCTPDQRKAGLDILCPPSVNVYECMKPVLSCLEESHRLAQEAFGKGVSSLCASYIKSDSQGLSSMMPWTLLLLCFV
jgi:hypothetical protein